MLECRETEVACDEREDEVAIRLMGLVVTEHLQHGDGTVLFDRVDTVGMGVDDDVLFVVLTGNDNIEGLGGSLFLDFCIEGQSGLRLFLSGFQKLFAGLFIDPEGRDAEVAENEVQVLALDHLVRHFLPNEDRGLRAGELGKEDADSRFDERDGDRTLVEPGQVQVGRHGTAFGERDRCRDAAEVGHAHDDDVLERTEFGQFAGEAFRAGLAGIRERGCDRDVHIALLRVKNELRFFLFPALEGLDIRHRFITDGADLFLEVFDEFVVAFRTGQSGPEGVHVVHAFQHVLF